MQSDTRIFVFRLRQLLTFLLVLIILIAAAVFILFVIGSSKKDVQTSPASAYTAGVYTSSITLNNQSVDIQVVVDKDHIKSASIVNLDESVAAMYPLLTTSMDAISAQLAAGVSIDDIRYDFTGTSQCHRPGDRQGPLTVCRLLDNLIQFLHPECHAGITRHTQIPSWRNRNRTHLRTIRQA